jgi:pimeloyl-ACP methyl ester carboxylesterase
MKPVTFGECFGWLHEGEGRTGVVLCGSFGQEGMITYRGWRALADELAGVGFHVLRFDYPGMGDSLGTETDPDRLGAWTASIHDAAEYLCALTGADQIILIGLRLGGALALDVSGGMPRVIAVACIVPVLAGKTYIRELRLMTNAWRDANLLPVAASSDGCLEVVGDRLTEATLRELSGFNLRTIGSAASHVMLMDDDAYPSTADLAARLTSLGCAVTRSHFPEASEYLQDSLTDYVPHKSFARLAQWCCQFRSGPAIRSSIGQISPSPAHLSISMGGEEPFPFGGSKEFFGILCLPRVRRQAAPTVIMVNTGFGRRVGDGRIYVALARRLAAVGVPSLRMDLAGFGDSQTLPDQICDPYSSSHAADVSAACDALERKGLLNPVVVGICSGAYAAFHAAVADQRVQGAIIVNLQKFVWNQGISLKVENRRTRRPAGFYLRAFGARKAWKRLLRGEVETVSIITSLIKRPLTSAFREVCLRIETATGVKTSAGGVLRSIKSLSERNTNLDLIYSDGDPGLSELAKHVGSKFRRLSSMPNVQVTVLGAADHALLDHNAKSQFINLVVDRLKGEDREDDAPMSVRVSPPHPETANASS